MNGANGVRATSSTPFDTTAATMRYFCTAERRMKLFCWLHRYDFFLAKAYTEDVNCTFTIRWILCGCSAYVFFSLLFSFAQNRSVIDFLLRRLNHIFTSLALPSLCWFGASPHAFLIYHCKAHIKISFMEDSLDIFIYIYVAVVLVKHSCMIK